MNYELRITNDKGKKMQLLLYLKFIQIKKVAVSGNFSTIFKNINIYKRQLLYWMKHLLLLKQMDNPFWRPPFLIF